METLRLHELLDAIGWAAKFGEGKAAGYLAHRLKAYLDLEEPGVEIELAGLLDGDEADDFLATACALIDRDEQEEAGLAVVGVFVRLAAAARRMEREQSAPRAEVA